MGSASKWRSGAASDTGLLRSQNEDRYWVDDEHGIFLVVDGVGGRVAGEMAAQTAVDVIREEALRGAGSPDDKVRRAITLANNAIYEAAENSGELRGMACVLTLAVVDDDRITIGHVGDSRLYLIWNGSIRKLTSDHSPVGEEEDAGELTEEEAMLHPRRNEVFRDVGTARHSAGDEEFIEIRNCHFKPDAAFLLCSDGLTDHLTSAQVRGIVDRYDGDAARVACELIEAANEAGGKDNITALFVAGPEFRGRDAGARQSTTRFRYQGPWFAGLADAGASIFRGRLAFLIYGLLLGMLVWAAVRGARG